MSQFGLFRSIVVSIIQYDSVAFLPTPVPCRCSSPRVAVHLSVQVMEGGNVEREAPFNFANYDRDTSVAFANYLRIETGVANHITAA